jgi:arylsulfatase
VGAGGIRHQVGHVVDLMATCLDAAGVPYPEEYRGRTVLPTEGASLLPAFAGRPVERRSGLFWEHSGNRAVRIGDWKLVAESGGAWELYDLSSDRTETRDLAGTEPARVRQMAEAWEAWAARVGVRPWPVR